MAGSRDTWGRDQRAPPWPQVLCQVAVSAGRGAWPALALPSTPRGCVVPAAPPRALCGGEGRLVTAPPSADREFIEARRRALKRFVNLVARHPPFSEDVVLKLFLSFSGPVSSSGTGSPLPRAVPEPPDAESGPR